MQGQSENGVVCVVGLGYVGLPMAAVLARAGRQVVGVDVRPEVVEAINRGEVVIHEPGLDELVAEVVAAGRLRASVEPVEADVFVLCVPTPVCEDRSPDLSYVRAAAEAIRPWVREGALVVLESTSPPGTTQEAVADGVVPEGWVVGRDVFVAHCPERVLPGQILQEVVGNDRVVGGITDECTERAAEFYDSFVSGAVLRTDARTAEMVKLVENSFRDVNIAFANELSMLASGQGVDPFRVIELANRHPRVNVLQPGPGVGGHCIGVDPWFLVSSAPEATDLIQTARRVNDAKPEFVVGQVLAAAKEKQDPVIGCLGLAYKSGTGDLRESPSLQVARRLNESGEGTVLVCDPYVDEQECPDLAFASLADVLEQSDVLVMLTDHSEFHGLSPASWGDAVVVDPRGCWRESACAGAV